MERRTDQLNSSGREKLRGGSTADVLLGRLGERHLRRQDRGEVEGGEDREAVSRSEERVRYGRYWACGDGAEHFRELAVFVETEA